MDKLIKGYLFWLIALSVLFTLWYPSDGLGVNVMNAVYLAIPAAVASLWLTGGMPTKEDLAVFSPIAILFLIGCFLMYHFQVGM